MLVKTVHAASAAIKLLETPVEVLQLVRTYLPFGAARFAESQHGAEYGLVMQCGEREVYAIKQQHPDMDGADGDFWYGASIVLVAASLASYARNGFEGLLLPSAYRRVKEGGRAEVGFAYFGHASADGPETQQGSDEPKTFVERFGPGFFVMIKQFIQALVESAARNRFPIQETIIGMDVRKRSELEEVNLGFLVVGPHIVCIKTQIVETDLIWDYLAKSGVGEVYHMPCIPIEIPEKSLPTAKWMD